MCEKKRCCCESSVVRIKPEECTPEQIRACHGDSGEHPCTDPNHPCQCGECPEGEGSS